MPSLVAISDLHCGSSKALCVPKIEFDETDEEESWVYKATNKQMWIWKRWLEFCKLIPKGSIGYLNGDVLQGTNVLGGAMVSLFEDHQIMIAVKSLEPFLERCSITYWTFGTEFHEGKDGHNLRALVQVLDTMGYPVTKPRNEIWHEDGYKNIFHFAHHRNVSKAASSKATPLNNSLLSMMFEAPLRNGVYPNYVIRSHAHDPGMWHSPRGVSIALPSWQTKTDLAWRAMPHVAVVVGGLIMTLERKEKMGWSERMVTYTEGKPTISRMQLTKK